MNWLRHHFEKSPVVARAAPFILFLLLTGLAGQFDGVPRFYLYLLKTLAGAWLLWLAKPHIAELQWKFSMTAVLGGVAIFTLWIGLDGFYPPLGKANPWSPHQVFGEGTVLAWFFIGVRVFGSVVVVPPLEEIFYRSFVYRYIASANFLNVPLNKFLPLPFLITAALFAVEHREWLPGLITGFLLQAMVIRTNRLGDAITAHAIANLLLGAWVVWRGAWGYW